MIRQSTTQPCTTSLASALPNWRCCSACLSLPQPAAAGCVVYDRPAVSSDGGPRASDGGAQQ
eukprot:13159980-Alexandrium_andersonii.AAC.1